ncbi:DUF2933 domain-containing protein [Paenibacillus sp. CN-4]|uniref:DUF2933 domain-containing protein n=1 Tax=Paenibacillus nanchangensis TaxID=3348343 RepID=UPI00397CED3A
MEWSTLLVLVCPIMMVVMMFAMKGGHSHGSPSQPRVTGHQQNQPAEREHEQMTELRAENERLRSELRSLNQ